MSSSVLRCHSRKSHAPAARAWCGTSVRFDSRVLIDPGLEQLEPYEHREGTEQEDEGQNAYPPVRLHRRNRSDASMEPGRTSHCLSHRSDRVRGSGSPSTGVDPGPSPIPSDSPASATPSPPPCSGEWAALIHIEMAPKHSTLEAAVSARDRREVLTVTAVKKDRASGMTYATVVDDWGRSGTYGLSHY